MRVIGSLPSAIARPERSIPTSAFVPLQVMRLRRHRNPAQQPARPYSLWGSSPWDGVLACVLALNPSRVHVFR